MKNIINMFNAGVLLSIVSGSAAFGFTGGLHAAAGEIDTTHISSRYFVESSDCAGEPGRDHRKSMGCINLEKIALNGFTTTVGRDLDPANLFSYVSDAAVPDTVTSPKISPANGAAVALDAKPDSQILTEVAPAATASLALEEGRLDEEGNTSDSNISEPLLTSILALIAIVAVARRNVSGG